MKFQVQRLEDWGDGKRPHDVGLPVRDWRCDAECDLVLIGDPWDHVVTREFDPAERRAFESIPHPSLGMKSLRAKTVPELREMAMRDPETALLSAMGLADPSGELVANALLIRETAYGGPSRGEQALVLIACYFYDGGSPIYRIDLLQQVRRLDPGLRERVLAVFDVIVGRR